MGQMSMSDVGTTQDNFILPAPPVGGLPIYQDWLDRMKLVRNRTIPIILPIGSNILVNMVFKVSIRYTNLDTRQVQRRRIEHMHVKSGRQNISILIFPTLSTLFNQIR